MKCCINFNWMFRVWSQAIAGLMVVSLIAASTAALAHQGERIFPIYEITDEMLELIDLDDGSIDEWEALFEPSVRALDFVRSIRNRSTLKKRIEAYDPSDLDFRVWLGWNGTHNRLYVSGQFVDDIHVREGTRRHAPDYISLNVDGDHTGGQYRLLTGERYRDNFVHAQTYTAPYFYEPDFSVGLSYNSFGEPYDFFWAGEFPYAYGGVGAVGENPVVWIVEFYITPFDLLDMDPANSLVTELKGGKIIGFFLGVGDGDLDEEEGDWYGIDGGIHRGAGNPNHTADVFVDGMLLKAGDFLEGSAVQPSSWGLIKASLRP